MTDFTTRLSAQYEFPKEIAPRKNEFDEEATIAAIRAILCDNEDNLPEDVILTGRDRQTGQMYPGAAHGFPALNDDRGRRGFLTGLLSWRR